MGLVIIIIFSFMGMKNVLYETLITLDIYMGLLLFSLLGAIGICQAVIYNHMPKSDYLNFSHSLFFWWRQYFHYIFAFIV